MQCVAQKRWDDRSVQQRLHLLPEACDMPDEYTVERVYRATWTHDDLFLVRVRGRPAYRIRVWIKE